VSAPSAAPVLRIRDLQAFYGESHVLHGVDLDVAEGEVVTLLGRNGSGRTSTLKSILGLVGRRTGSIQVGGQETVGMAPHRIARLGIGVGYCPEERGIFASLTTEENLQLLPRIGAAGMPDAEIYAMFPNLLERRRSQGTRLSGGEQQMLAMGRALMAKPTLLLLDEPSMGLSPILVEQIFDIVQSINKQGTSILLVEQNAQMALSIADRAYVLETGEITLEGKAQDVLHNPMVIEAYLGGH